MYSTHSVTICDKFPPTPSKVFIKLALVKKNEVSREEADNFTCLTLRGDIDEILQVKKQIKLDNILKADDKVRLVVVDGAPGIGKSTLAWELCRQWPTLESMKRFSLVVLLRLREERVQSATNICDLFYHRDTQLGRHVGEEVVKREGDGVLFVFDGFDEFPSELQRKSLVMDIVSGSELPKATVLVTSRPSASAQLQKLHIGKHIEVMGFSQKEILEFAHSILADSLTNFRQYLSANPVVKGMMYNPLNCAIVVGVYQDTFKSGKSVPHTQTQLYTELTLCLLSRYLSATGNPLATKLPDKLEDLPHDSDLYQQLVKVGKLAYNGKLKEQVIFKQLPKGCSDLGLLVEHTALYTRKETTTYNFFHLTLQEYMSAFYISQLPADEQRTLFRENNSISMDVVWRFVAGLTKMENLGWEEVKKAKRGNCYRVEDDVVGVGPFLLECLYEAQDVKSFESVFGQHKMAYRVYGLTNYDLYVLGYCISVCSNTWDLMTFSIPREGLEMFGHGMNSVDYGGGSIEEIHLYRGKGIMNEGKHLLQIPHQILRHIKSMKVSECNIDRRGFKNLAECIPYLHSLTSLDINDNPGGDGSLVKLLKALRKHGKLETLDMTCLSIGMDDVAALAGLVQPSSSLRDLKVGGSDESPPATYVAKQLVRTVLSPSSLDTVVIMGCKYPLDDIKIIFGISSLKFVWSSFMDWNLWDSPRSPTANHRKVKGSTKLSTILRKNTSLKYLELCIPLHKDELHDVIDSLKDNHSLKRLQLAKNHSRYFENSEKQALDPRVYFS